MSRRRRRKGWGSPGRAKVSRHTRSAALYAGNRYFPSTICAEQDDGNPTGGIMKNNKGVLLVLAAVLLWGAIGLRGAAGQGDGSLYEWTDDRGIVNVTDDISKVPDKYRSRAKKLGRSDAVQEGQGAVSPQAPSAPAAV